MKTIPMVTYLQLTKDVTLIKSTQLQSNWQYTSVSNLLFDPLHIFWVINTRFLQIVFVSSMAFGILYAYAQKE